LREALDERFSEACDLVLKCRGQVVVTGVGKAGLIGQKISATLASTGTPSFFLNPTDALHGDLGRIRSEDVVLALSNSGESAEIRRLIPAALRIGACLIAITGQPESALARHATCVLEIGELAEACPLGLAPTASTAAMLAIGDALSMVVMRERGFGREDYALFHPAGSLGRKLMKVREVMRQNAELPLVSAEATCLECLETMTQTPGRPGAALIVDGEGRLVGIFTDGDLRRLLATGRTGLFDESIEGAMGKNPKTVAEGALVAEAEAVMKEHKIDQIAVLDDEGRPVGLLDVQDLLDLRN
ncbi:MAG: KpsF/GutQ family sugar-phosphate isomerase, partial [Planctomycetota bacterium]